MKITAPNLNHFWTQLLVEELVRQGVAHFCVAPGSRSTPLALAVASNKKAKATVHFDERSLGFFALGCARATGRPAVVITTSGSAAANLLPAVVEASRDGVSMIVITADRPPELRDANANQTIDQVKIFGDFARWSVDLPCPDLHVPPQYVLTTAAHAVFRAADGPVHLNCMFREPLAPVRDGVNLRVYARPIEKWLRGNRSHVTYGAHSSVAAPAALKKAASVLQQARKGLIVVGPGCGDAGAVAKLAEKLAWPVLADIQSGLRTGRPGKFVVTNADAIAAAGVFLQRHQPDTVLHVGGRLTSKRVAQFLASSPARARVIVDRGCERPDATHGAALRLVADPGETCASLARLVRQGRRGKWLNDWLRADATVGKIVAAELVDLSEPFVARSVSELIPAGHGLFVASSMPVRDLDLAASDRSRAVRVAANRGASGIDGTLSTAAGFAAGLGASVTVVVGDLALLHDLNGLALLKSLGQPVTVVVVNNDGGGIFSFLPVAETSEHFEKFLGTPHGLSFKDAAAMFGLPYVAPERAESFRMAYAAAVKSGRSSIIEVRTRRDENRDLHASLLKQIARAVDRV